MSIGPDAEEAALRALLTINQSARRASPDDVIDLYLEQAVRLTHSKIGFFHMVGDDGRSVLIHTAYGIPKVPPAGPGPSDPLPDDGPPMFHEALASGKPVIRNEPPHMPGGRIPPPGIPPVERELVVPILEAGRPVAIMGVANREAPYGEDDADRLSLVADNAWLIVRRRQAEDRREQVLAELEQALTSVRRLSGLVPICTSCKKVRDDTGYWQQVEAYVSERSEAEFTHGVCPECCERLYGQLGLRVISRQ
jgi:GAF domain-containing protein